MISEDQTNFLYLADTLPVKYPSFYKELGKILNANDINYNLLPSTKDIWAVDYMPIQVALDKFVRFTYKPIYLRDIKYSKTISDADLICSQIGISTIKSDFIIDGGNVTRYKNQVILTERIIKENPAYERSALINALKNILEVETLYIIPEQPNDFTGHSDGMVRFLSDKALLINDYQNERPQFRKAFEKAIEQTGLDCIQIPYNPYGNSNYDQANGDYINYLQMEGLIILPVFDMKQDEIVVSLFERIFSQQKVVTINANEIANEGGVLNCISWNIMI